MAEFDDEVASVRALRVELQQALREANSLRGASFSGGIGGASYHMPTSGDRSSIRARDIKQGGQNLIGAAQIGSDLSAGNYLGAAYAGTGLIRGNKGFIRGAGRIVGTAATVFSGVTSGAEKYPDLMKGDYKGTASGFLQQVAMGAAIGVMGGPAGIALGAVAGGVSYVAGLVGQHARPSDGGRFFSAVFRGDFMGAASQLGGGQRDAESKQFKDVQQTLIALKNEIGYLPSESAGMTATTIEKFRGYFDGEKGKEKYEEILTDSQEINRQISLGNTMDAAILEAKLSVKVGSDLSRRLIPPVSTGERWIRSDTALRAAKAWSALYAPRAQRVEYD